MSWRTPEGSNDKQEPLLPPEAPDNVQHDGASVCEATLSLVKVCVGSGIYALPWAVAQGGALAVPGILALVGWNWYTAWQLLASREAMASRGGDGATTQRSAYSTLVYAALGAAGVWVLEGALVTVLLGACAGMQIQAAQLLNSMSDAVRWGARHREE